MESTEVEVMASSLVAQATKPGFAHTAVDPCLRFKHVCEGVDGMLVSVIRGIQEGHRSGFEANANPRRHNRCVLRQWLPPLES
jgi:hypothetical protein